MLRLPRLKGANSALVTCLMVDFSGMSWNDLMSGSCRAQIPVIHFALNSCSPANILLITDRSLGFNKVGSINDVFLLSHLKRPSVFPIRSLEDRNLLIILQTRSSCCFQVVTRSFEFVKQLTAGPLYSLRNLLYVIRPKRYLQRGPICQDVLTTAIYTE